ncbi:MAG: CHAT domain-containing tetratricopeptide repeat protein [Bacteroidia bacterium]|nr:CHAT domain-containing tetratricopeptide repeat protein [Bacteroidia bacterium]
MKKFYILAVLALTSHFCTAQYSIKDSFYLTHQNYEYKKSINLGNRLIATLSEKDKKDTAYSNILNLQFRNYLFLRDHKKALICAKEDSILQYAFNNLKDSIYFVLKARAINNLGTAYKNLYEYKLAEHCYLYVLEYVKNNLGELHLAYSNACNDIGLLYFNTQNLSKAELFLKKCLEIDAKLIGKNHLDYGLTCNNLGLLYLYVGNYEKSMYYFKQSMDIYNFHKAFKHPRYTQVVNNLATLYNRLEKHDSALNLYKKNLATIEKIYSKEHDEYFFTLYNIAKTYFYTHHVDSSFFYINIILQSNNIKNNRKYQNHASELMVKYLYRIKEYIKADSLCDVLSDYEAKNEPYRVTNTIRSLQCKLKTTRVCNDTVIKKAERILNNVQYHIDNNLYTFSESEKQKFFEEFMYSAYFIILSAAVHYNHPALNQIAYNMVIKSKGLSLSDFEKVKKRILNSNDQKIKEMYFEWKAQKANYGKLASLPKDEQMRKKINLDSLKNLITEMEKKLSVQSQDFQHVFTPRKYDWQDIKNALKNKQACIEIFRIESLENTSKDSTVVYGALIIKKDSPAPDILIFPNSANLEKQFFTNYRRSIKNKYTDTLSYTVFWKPLYDKLKDIKTVYFSPDGIYHQINVSTLYNPETKKYVLDEVQVIHVTNTKDILNQHTYTTKNNYLIGNPKFDLQLNIKENEKTKQERTFEGFLEELSQLEGAEREVKQISAFLPNATCVIGADATEEYIKSIKNPRILHIATHGYFNKGQYQSSTQAMLNAGLLFAGVVSYDRMEIRPFDKEDGKLTAFEIMSMELDSTELVVLSACETGLGQTGKEGVYGLQRAFKVAGAQKIIMSLWKVNDEATQLLMTKFYENWQKKGMSKRRAFETAQKSLRKQYKEPYYWGAFVMIE